MVSLIIPVYQSTCILGVCVNQYGCLRVTPVKARVSSHTSIPVIPVHQSHQYTSLPVYQSSSSVDSHQYTSHTSIPACQYTSHSHQLQLPVYQSYQYTSCRHPHATTVDVSALRVDTPSSRVCEESSPLAAVIVLDHICTHRPCANRASRTSIFHLV